jgi:hypothetical protein
MNEPESPVFMSYDPGDRPLCTLEDLAVSWTEAGDSSRTASMNWTPTRFMKIPANPTVAQTLAIALLNGESCEKELIDCLLDETIGVVDWESAAIKKAEEMGRLDEVRIMYDVANERIRTLSDRGSMTHEHSEARAYYDRQIAIISDFCQRVTLARMKYPTK